MEVSHQDFREHLIEPTGRKGRNKHTTNFFFFFFWYFITVTLGFSPKVNEFFSVLQIPDNARARSRPHVHPTAMVSSKPPGVACEKHCLNQPVDVCVCVGCGGGGINLIPVCSER